MTDLKKLAEAATPGPWQQYDDEPATVAAATEQFEVYCPFSARGKYLTARLTVRDGFHRVEDAAYIAAAHPQKILELLQELETLRAKYEQRGLYLQDCEARVASIRQETLEEAAKVCETHVTWLNYTNIGGANAEKMRTAATLLDAIRALQHGETKV